MAILNAKQRARSAVIKRPGQPDSAQSYPIPDKAHARAALARINQGNLNPAQKAKVRAAAKAKLGTKKGAKK